MKRLEKRISSGKLTKSNINNRGYNKYLKLQGEISIEIDYKKYEKDSEWDGLKGNVFATQNALGNCQVSLFSMLYFIELRQQN